MVEENETIILLRSVVTRQKEIKQVLGNLDSLDVPGKMASLLFIVGDMSAIIGELTERLGDVEEAAIRAKIDG